MLNKRSSFGIFVLALIIIVMGFGVTVSLSADAPNDVLIENKYQAAKTYTATKFSHKKHAEKYTHENGQKISCDSCHHVYKDGKNIWKEGDKVDKCIVCHKNNQNLSPSKTKKMTKEEKVKEIAWAYHENCYNCHKAVKEVNKKSTAWTSCVKCHPKKK